LSLFLKPFAFLLILFGGYALKRAGLFHEGDHRLVSKIVLNLTMPAAVIHAFLDFQGQLGLFLGLILVGLVSTVLPYLLTFLMTKRVERARRIFLMVNASGFNVGCFGMPVIEGFWGASGAAIACMFDIGNSIMVTGGSYAFTSVLLPAEGTRIGLGAMVKKFLTSVPFDVYMLMLVLTAAGIAIPTPVGTVLEPLAQANSFAAMLMLGLMIQPPKQRGYLSAAARLILIRLGFSVLFSLLVYFFTPFDLYVRQILAVLLFAPSSVIATVYTEKCGGDPALAGFTNSITVIIGLIMMSCMSLLFQS